jgi:flavin reductase (DIM6/NTAB) family NADH-FMN oxidoreductase RutF
MQNGGSNMSEEFTEVRIIDNFYQTSGFFPMPVVLVSTLDESGATNLGPYSLCFPYIVTGGKMYSMLLIARPDSNTAQNIIRTKVCSLNFIPDKKKYIRNCVLLGYPGETTEQKMKNSIFTLRLSTRSGPPPKGLPKFPDIVEEAVQVFECTWNDSLPLKPIPSSEASHLVLVIDKIIMKKKWKDSLFKGKGFPHLPIDYGYRDNIQFWFTRHSRPYAVRVPSSKEAPVETVQYACERFDPDIKWEKEACAKIVKVPNIFLKRVISGVVEAAKKEGIDVITPEFMDKLQDKRSSER